MQVRVEGSLYHVWLAGEMNGRQAEEMYRGVLRDCVAAGCSKMLVDCRELSGELSTVDRFWFGKVVADENTAVAAGSGLYMRVAFVGRVPLFEERRLGQTVATNRGATVKVTEDLPSAYRWLGLDPPDE
jgi:hypothetical protein